MPNHFTRQKPEISAEQRDELQRWLRRPKTSQALGPTGTDNLGQRRRVQRHRHCGAIGNDARNGGEMAAAVSATRL